MSSTISLASLNPIQKAGPDPIPNIRGAGKIIPLSGNSDYCLRGDLFPHVNPGNLGTPESILKYRKLNRMKPGKILVHHGL